MESETSGLVKGLNEVNSKYAESNKELQKQEAELQRLLDLEKKLQDNRAKASSPNAIIKYNTELKNTKAEIDKVKASVENMTVANNKATKSTQDLNKQIKDAFDATKINSFKKEVQDTSKEIPKIAPTKAVNEFTKLKQELKQAKSELLAAFGTGNQKEIQKASEKVGRIKDQMNDLNESVNAFASGSKFQQIGNLFGDIGRNLLNLDFGRAREQSQALLATTKSLTFKEALKGVKDLGITLFNVGKSLLLNPIFLIGAAVTALIINFDKLKNSGGVVGKTFTAISEASEKMKDELAKLTDAIGLTNIAFQKLQAQRLTFLKELAQVTEIVAQRTLKIQNSLKLNTEKTEKERLKLIIKNANDQIKVYEKFRKDRGKLTDEEEKDLDELLISIGNATTDIKVLENEGYIRRKEAAEAYAKDIKKLFEDLNQKIKSESEKGKKFKIETEFEAGSVEQIKADFELRKQLEEDDIALTRKNARESVENFKKAELEKRKDAVSTSIINAKAVKELAEVEKKINKLRSIAELNRNRELQKALLDAEFNFQQERLEIEKNANLSRVEQFIASGKETEEEAAAERVSILIDYYDARQKLLEKQIANEKRLGLSTNETEKELADLIVKGQEEVAKALDAQLRLILKNTLAREDEEKRHQDVMNQLQGDSESQRLKKQLEFERRRLEILKESGKATEQELKEQQNKIEELEVTAREKRIQENIGYFEQISNAALDAADNIVAAKIKEVDKLSELQQKRVEDAKEIADEGNAELYELEQKRLDDLNKQREVFVKRQQALATIELIANTAIAVSKAAAQGGVAAAVTIAAALIALTGGLIQARSIASQAAYYEGGYTGEGDPKKESGVLGKKSYIYHNKEFVFNHEKTGKYRDIFEGIHRGDIDLVDWKRKVAAYEQLRIGAMFQQKQESVNLGGVESKLNYILNAIENQSTSVSLNENGLSMRFKKIRTRNDFIKKNLGRA